MSGEVKLLLYFIGAAAMSVAFAPLAIDMLKRLKAGQSVLGYVTQHEGKSGTPTIGGVIFLLPIIVILLIEFTPFSLVTASLIFGFAVLGFLDDFIKIKFKRNMGLKAYQKIIGQLGLSAIAAYFVYSSPYIGTAVHIPFAADLNFAWGIIPVVMFLFIALTNSVNLTDGLDGLAATTSVGYFLSLGIIMYFSYVEYSQTDAAYSEQLFSLTAASVAACGGLLGYLIFNSPPAKIMMGDTGSLGLGAAACCVAVFARQPLFILTSGIMFVWSSISVILQVLSFKATKKRVFKMAPFHHHLEMSGWSETRVDALYFFITMIGGALSLIFAGAV